MLRKRLAYLKWLLILPIVFMSSSVPLLSHTETEDTPKEAQPAPPPMPKAEEPVLRAPKSPTSPKVEGLELPADQEVSSTQRAVIIAAITKAKVVRWLVFNTIPKSPVAYVEVVGAKNLILFPNDQDDIITVIAYTAIDGMPTEPARTLVHVKVPGSDGKPDKTDDKPGQGPKPLPRGIKLHVTMVFDHQKMTKQRSELENSKALREALKTQGHALHVLDVKQKAIDDAELRTVVNRDGPFCLVIQRDDNGVILHSGPLPADDQGVLDQVSKVMNGGK
jgi:hypothetical protein